MRSLDPLSVAGSLLLLPVTAICTPVVAQLESILIEPEHPVTSDNYKPRALGAASPNAQRVVAPFREVGAASALVI
jgi:hypothetical protein